MHNNSLPLASLTKISNLVASFSDLQHLSPMDRFNEICHRENIRYEISDAWSNGGVYIRYKTQGLFRPSIYLESGLHDKHLPFVAFHELGHHFLNHDRDTRWNEFEAHYFSFLALSDSFFQGQVVQEVAL